MTGNNKPLTGVITSFVGYVSYMHPPTGLELGYVIGKFGEDKLSQRSIDIGKSYIKNK